MAKRRKCKRTKTTWQGVEIALPCGSTKLTQAHKDTLDESYSQAEWNKAKGGKCRVIFYTKNRVAMRCDKNRGGGMARAAKRRYLRMVREGEICLKEKGHKYRFSNRC